MTDNEIMKVGIFAITKNFPDQISRVLPNGRLKRLYGRLDKETVRLLKRCPQIKQSDKQTLDERLTAWTQLTRWDKQGKHPVTVTAFLIGIISDNIIACGKLLIMLQDVYNYFERAGKSYPACSVGGYIASQKFNQVFSTK